MFLVTCGRCRQGTRAAVDEGFGAKSTETCPPMGREWLGGSAAPNKPSASADGLARRPAFEDQGRMRPCLADLDGSRWRSAVFYKYPSGRRVSVALRKLMPKDRGGGDRTGG